MVFSRIIKAFGSLKLLTYEIYKDPALSELLTVIDWGTLTPGEQKGVTAYIQSTSTFSLLLALTTTNWNPDNAGDFIALDWDYTGTPLNPREVRKVVLTLVVDPTIKDITNFSFDITISASE